MFCFYKFVFVTFRAHVAILLLISFHLENYQTSIRFKVSDIKLLLMKESSGESVPKAGLKFTSSNQGLSSESIKISKP